MPKLFIRLDRIHPRRWHAQLLPHEPTAYDNRRLHAGVKASWRGWRFRAYLLGRQRTLADA